jgi:hypothetical protein
VTGGGKEVVDPMVDTEVEVTEKETMVLWNNSISFEKKKRKEKGEREE